jgi:hypothetical protein
VKINSGMDGEYIRITNTRRHQILSSDTKYEDDSCDNDGVQMINFGHLDHTGNKSLDGVR